MSHRDKSSFVSGIWRHEIQNKQTLVACGGKRSQEGNFCIAIIVYYYETDFSHVGTANIPQIRRIPKRLVRGTPFSKTHHTLFLYAVPMHIYNSKGLS